MTGSLDRVHATDDHSLKQLLTIPLPEVHLMHRCQLAGMYWFAGVFTLSV